MQHSNLMERSVKVPETMYKSFLVLQNPRKLAVFDLLCRAKGKMATKDIELSLQEQGTGETLGYIADALRDLEDVKLAKYVDDDSVQIKPIPGKPQSRVGDWKQTFKCYEATEHGQYIHELCRSYDSDRPLANLGSTLDPKRVVESFAKLQKDELAIMLNRFRDMYLLGAALMSIHYQKHESATSDYLSRCLDGRLSKDEVEKFLGDYTGPEGLLVATSVDRSIIDRALIRLGELLAGRNRVRKWLSNASYSLTPEGQRIVGSLADEFYPSELGVNEEYLRPEKIEADDGVLGKAIAERVIIYGAFVGITAYVWFDLFHKLRFNSSDSLGIVFDLISMALTIFGWSLYMPSRLANLFNRIIYWRKLRKERVVRNSV